MAVCKYTQCCVYIRTGLVEYPQGCLYIHTSLCGCIDRAACGKGFGDVDGLIEREGVVERERDVDKLIN